jgi:hypothetical protein
LGVAAGGWGVDVGVSVGGGVGVFVLVGVLVGLGVSVAVGSGVEVGIAVGVGVAVGGGVLVGEGGGVCVGAIVRVGDGVGVDMAGIIPPPIACIVPSRIKPATTTPPAAHTHHGTTRRGRASPITRVRPSAVTAGLTRAIVSLLSAAAISCTL